MRMVIFLAQEILQGKYLLSISGYKSRNEGRMKGRLKDGRRTHIIWEGSHSIKVKKKNSEATKRKCQLLFYSDRFDLAVRQHCNKSKFHSPYFSTSFRIISIDSRSNQVKLWKGRKKKEEMTVYTVGKSFLYTVKLCLCQGPYRLVY